MENIMSRLDSNITRRTFVKGGVAGTALFLGEGTLPVHAASMKHSQHSGTGINVLLVHGAFVDASSWSKVIPLLQDQGYNVLAVQNPNMSLHDDIAMTSQALASLSGPTILVGHSYGGVVISNIGGNTSNILGLVYLAAFAPVAGESALNISTRFPVPASKHLVPSYRSGFIWIDPQVFPQNFIQDVDLAEGRALSAV
jgi:pimeloyl-ACP methyl ester carboxylesterase